MLHLVNIQVSERKYKRVEVFFLMIRRPPRSTQSRSSAASDVYKRQGLYITAGYWFTSSTSFANPAVTIARTFTESFTGISYLNTPYYIAAELISMLIAIYLVKKIFLNK